MPDSSSGNFSLVPGYLGITGQTITASQHNGPLEDLGAAMSRRYMRDGRAPMLGNVPMNGYRATGAGDAEDDQDYVTLGQVQALIAAAGTVPTGAMLPLTSTVVPAGWLVLNGQAVSRETYAALWAHAQASGMLAATQGTKTHGQFGPGNGATTFTLPNLYADDGYFIRPMASGRTIGSVQTDEFKAHTHAASFDGNQLPSHSHGGTYLRAGGSGGTITGSDSFDSSGIQSASAGTPSGSVTVTSNGGSETRPRNIAYPVLIKT